MARESDKIGPEKEIHHSDLETNNSNTTTRRTFIATAASGAGLLLTGRALSQTGTVASGESATPAVVENVHSADDVNIALIGAGAQGAVLMDSLLRIPGVRVKAVCDIWEYSRRRSVNILKKYGHEVTAYEDYRDLLDKEKNLQAAIVATPDFVHAEHAIACMKAGLDVYCESAISNDLESARRMILESRKKGRLLQIGLQRRSNPRYQHAVQLMVREKRLLGRLTNGYAQWNRSKSELIGWPKKYEIKPEVLKKYGYDSMEQFRNWRWYKKTGGGTFLGLASHQIDVFNWAFGSLPVAVYACGGIEANKKHEWPDNIFCILEYKTWEGPIQVVYEVTNTNGYGSFYENVFGEEGTLAISEHPSRGDMFVREPRTPDWELYSKEGLLGQPNERLISVAKAVTNVTVSPPGFITCFPIPVNFETPIHQPHLQNFLDAVREHKPSDPSAEQAYQATVVAKKIYASLKEQRRKRFTPREFVV